MGGSPVQPKVIEALEEKFVGRQVTIDQLLRATGLERSQLFPVMLRLSQSEGSGVVRVGTGVWSYRAGEKPADTGTDTHFELVGRTAERDEIIVRGDVTGRLYKVVAF